MTHIVATTTRSLHGTRFNKGVGAVRVRRVGKSLVVEHGLAIAHWDTVWVPLPTSIPVVHGGAEIKPASRFWITVESIDPYHLLCDRPEPT